VCSSVATIADMASGALKEQSPTLLVLQRRRIGVLLAQEESLATKLSGSANFGLAGLAPALLVS